MAPPLPENVGQVLGVQVVFERVHGASQQRRRRHGRDGWLLRVLVVVHVPVQVLLLQWWR